MSILNLLPRSVGDLLTTTRTMGHGRDGSGRTIPTANGNNCKYDDKRGNKDEDNCGGLLVFVWEQDLLLVTPAMTDVGIICPCMSLQLPPSSSPLLLSLSCQSVLPLLPSSFSSPTSSVSTAVSTDTSSMLQHQRQTRRSPAALD